MTKHEKYLKSKNDVKKLLGAFNHELWAIYGFLNSGQNLKNYGRLPQEKRFKKLFDQKGVSAPRKLCSLLKEKNVIKKDDFSSKKNEKYLKSKMTLKRL